MNVPKSNLEQLDCQTKRGIIKALVERIQIGYDQVEVAFRIEEPAQDERFLICNIVLDVMARELAKCVKEFSIG